MSDDVRPADGDLKEASSPEEIVWEFDIPLLTNPFILLDMAKVLGITFAITSLLFAFIGVFQGEFRAMMPIISMFAVIVAAIGVVMILVMLIGYRNRFHCRFAVNRQGVGYSVSQVQRKINRAVIVLGVLSMKPGAAGAGLLAAAQESAFFDYTSIHRADLIPRRRVVCIRNSWRTILRVYCTPDNYESVATMVVDSVDRAALARSKSIAEGRQVRSTMLKRMAWLPVVVIAAILSTAQPLLDGGFGLVWAIAGVLVLGAICAGAARRLAGIAGLLMVVALICSVIVNGLKVTSFANGLVHWNGFSTATDAEDLPLFVLGCIGTLGLLVMCVRNIVSGKTR